MSTTLTPQGSAFSAMVNLRTIAKVMLRSIEQGNTIKDTHAESSKALLACCDPIQYWLDSEKVWAEAHTSIAAAIDAVAKELRLAMRQRMRYTFWLEAIITWADECIAYIKEQRQAEKQAATVEPAIEQLKTAEDNTMTAQANTTTAQATTATTATVTAAASAKAVTTAKTSKQPRADILGYDCSLVKVGSIDTELRKIEHKRLAVTISALYHALVHANVSYMDKWERNDAVLFEPALRACFPVRWNKKDGHYLFDASKAKSWQESLGVTFQTEAFDTFAAKVLEFYRAKETQSKAKDLEANPAEVKASCVDSAVRLCKRFADSGISLDVLASVIELARKGELDKAKAL